MREPEIEIRANLLCFFRVWEDAPFSLMKHKTLLTSESFNFTVKVFPSLNFSACPFFPLSDTNLQVRDEMQSIHKIPVFFLI